MERYKVNLIAFYQPGKPPPRRARQAGAVRTGSSGGSRRPTTKPANRRSPLPPPPPSHTSTTPPLPLPLHPPSPTPFFLLPLTRLNTLPVSSSTKLRVFLPYPKPSAFVSASSIPFDRASVRVSVLFFPFLAPRCFARIATPRPRDSSLRTRARLVISFLSRRRFFSWRKQALPAAWIRVPLAGAASNWDSGRLRAFAAAGRGGGSGLTASWRCRRAGSWSSVEVFSSDSAQ